MIILTIYIYVCVCVCVYNFLVDIDKCLAMVAVSQIIKVTA
jgi:hypothetical protein